ncbi:MAG: hypothetical protein MJ162_01780 [Treponema sp.]|nr:hypothetical protein [Treponema sp.]
MTEEEIKEFFMVTEKNLNSYLEVRNTFTDQQIAENPEFLVTGILKKTYGYPITFMDEAAEELIHVSEERSQKVYEEYAKEIINGYYEDLYDFTQEISDCFRNFPEE